MAETTTRVPLRDGVANGWPDPDRTAVRLRPGEVLSHMLAVLLVWLPWLGYAGAVLALMLLVSYEVEAEGLRILQPSLAKKLHRVSIPEIHRLRGYAGWNKVDLANCIAVLLALATFWAWDTFLKNYLSARGHVHPQWNAAKFGTVMTIVAVGVITFDCYSFYTATQALLWGSGGLSFGCLAMTVGWALLIVVASLVSIRLQPVSRF